MRVGLERTGRTIPAAALLFAIAIGAFATSSLIFIKELNLGTALAILIDASIVRALSVPSLMDLLGRRAWWAPRPLRRLHERIGLTAGVSSIRGTLAGLNQSATEKDGESKSSPIGSYPAINWH